MIHISDTTAAFVGIVVGPILVLFGAIVNDRNWDRWYGSDGREGRLYAPILSRLPRVAGRAFFIATGLVMIFGGVLLFALGRG